MKKGFALLSFVLILILAGQGAFAQSSKDGDIPSDLFKDLEFAQQNPAPEQKQIVETQVSEAETVTENGETNTVAPKDVVPEEIKIEKADDVVNPEQSTSEQVKEVTVEQPAESAQPESSPSENQPGTENSSPEDSVQPDTLTPQSDNSSTSPGSDNPSGTTNSNDVIPGTTIIEPDDNAAPPTPSTEPQSAAPQGETSAPAEPTTTESQPPAENQTQAGEEGSVQGAKTINLSIWQRVISLVFGR